jgi:hypothetical protein
MSDKRARALAGAGFDTSAGSPGSQQPAAEWSTAATGIETRDVADVASLKGGLSIVVFSWQVRNIQVNITMVCIGVFRFKGRYALIYISENFRERNFAGSP